jgi:hypothetical protein
MVFPSGRVTDTGEIVEIKTLKRLVIRWQNEFRPELKADGCSLCTIELEPGGIGRVAKNHFESQELARDRSAAGECRKRLQQLIDEQ